MKLHASLLIVAACLLPLTARADLALHLCTDGKAVVAQQMLRSSAIVLATVDSSQGQRRTMSNGRWTYDWQATITVTRVLAGKQKLGKLVFRGGCGGLARSSMNHCSRPPAKTSKQVALFLQTDKDGKAYLIPTRAGSFGRCPGAAEIARANKKYLGVLDRIVKIAR